MATSSRIDHHLDQFVDGKYLQSIKTKAKIKTKEAGGGERRSRIKLSREMSVVSNSSFIELEFEGGYHAQEAAAVPFVWESSPGTPKHHIHLSHYSSHNNNIITSDSIDHHHHHLSPPPLTPPPSYQYFDATNSRSNHNGVRRTRLYTSSKKNNSNKIHNHSATININLIQSLLLPRLSLKKECPRPHPLVVMHTAASPSSHPSYASSPFSSSSSRKSLSLSSSSSSSRPAFSGPSSSPSVAMPPPFPRRSGSQGRSSIQNHRLSFDSRIQADNEEATNTSGCGSPDSTLCFTSGSSSYARFRACYSTMFKVLRGPHHLA